MKPLVIMGAGGQAREIAQLVADINQAKPNSWNLLGFIADPQALTHHRKPLPAPLLGDTNWLALHPAAQVVVAIGHAAGRREVAHRLCSTYPDLHFATLVHPRAWLADRVTLGQGSVVFSGSLINVDVSIGQHASVNLGCTISHDCVLGSFVNLGPGVHLAGGCEIDDEADLGTGVCVIPEVHIGKCCTIGAGAVVLHHLPDDCTAVGVPARTIPKYKVL